MNRTARNDLRLCSAASARARERKGERAETSLEPRKYDVGSARRAAAFRYIPYPGAARDSTFTRDGLGPRQQGSTRKPRGAALDFERAVLRDIVRTCRGGKRLRVEHCGQARVRKKCDISECGGATELASGRCERASR